MSLDADPLLGVFRGVVRQHQAHLTGRVTVRIHNMGQGVPEFNQELPLLPHGWLRT